jgi:hypothetical protein
MVKYIGYAWFNGRSCIGIVLTHNEETDELRAFIEKGHEFDEFSDIDYIMSWGSRFPVDDAISLILKVGTIACPIEEFDRLISMYKSKNSEDTKPDGGNSPPDLSKS